jgi:hypothetical protein
MRYINALRLIERPKGKMVQCKTTAGHHQVAGMELRGAADATLGAPETLVT